MVLLLAGWVSMGLAGWMACSFASFKALSRANRSPHGVKDLHLPSILLFAAWGFFSALLGTLLLMNLAYRTVCLYRSAQERSLSGATGQGAYPSLNSPRLDDDIAKALAEFDGAIPDEENQ